MNGGHWIRSKYQHNTHISHLLCAHGWNMYGGHCCCQTGLPCTCAADLERYRTPQATSSANTQRSTNMIVVVRFGGSCSYASTRFRQSGSEATSENSSVQRGRWLGEGAKGDEKRNYAP